MSQFVALFTSDAALVRCELDRVRRLVALGGPAEAVGVGAWQDGQVVQRQYGVGVPVEAAWEAAESEVVLLASRALGVGQGVDESAQPFRFRHWFFAAAGELARADAVRERLVGELPEFLQGTLRGRAWEEAAFARFLAELRALGRIEDPELDAATAARLLDATARAVEQVSSAVGVAHRPGFALAASNGQVLVTTRRGGQPLWYTLLEGQAECPRHAQGPDARDAETLARDHRRRRSVVVASGVTAGEGWVSVADGVTLAVDRRLAVALTPR